MFPFPSFTLTSVRGKGPSAWFLDPLGVWSPVCLCVKSLYDTLGDQIWPFSLFFPGVLGVDAHFDSLFRTLDYVTWYCNGLNIHTNVNIKSLSSGRTLCQKRTTCFGRNGERYKFLWSPVTKGPLPFPPPRRDFPLRCPLFFNEVKQQTLWLSVREPVSRKINPTGSRSSLTPPVSYFKPRSPESKSRFRSTGVSSLNVQESNSKG